METYNLRKPEKEFVPDFEYVYPETLDIDNNIFVHLGYGLYMISQEDAKNRLTDESVTRYHRLRFVGFYNGDVGFCDVRIVFAYSKLYSCWNEGMIRLCLLERLSMFHVPQDLLPKMNDVIARIRKAEEKDNYRENLWICGNSFTMDELSDLDAPFDFSQERKQDKYIMLKGRVGTRVAERVFEFKAPFRINVENNGKMICYAGTYSPTISCHENAINHDCVVLYSDILSDGDWGG